MYSSIESVQVVIALLKAHSIQDVVLSPGGSDIPLVHSFESDSDFICHSVVDERSAAYFALGIAQQKRKPCVCVCTSGTAVCNYLPGITEAFYQSVPVIAITADKNPYYQGQLETQKIEQRHIFDGVVKKSVSLPVINNEQDRWLCNRLVNEALLELDHHGVGPVHINMPFIGTMSQFDCERLPQERVIERVELKDEVEKWTAKIKKLDEYKKILVIVGQNANLGQKDIYNLESFYHRFDCVFAVEHVSNLKFAGAVFTYPISEMMSVAALDILKPDLIISLGNNTAAYGWKNYFRPHFREMDSWLVLESGEIRDTYKSLTTVFECSESMFFDIINETFENADEVEHGYFNLWQNELKKIEIPAFDFSNFYVAQKLASVIPQNSILHLAIQYSTRIMHYFDLADGVRTFSNYGALGIDGCLSTFAGQAAATDELAYLVIGDLSFFYDMNAAGLKSIGKNVRIIMINNGGGEEFRFIFNQENFDAYKDDNICANHSKEAEGWIKSLGYEYYSAASKEEVDSILPKFAEESDRPMFLEVFTDLGETADVTRSFYKANQVKYPANQEKNNYIKKVMKGIVKSVVPKRNINQAKAIIRAIRESK